MAVNQLEPIVIDGTVLEGGGQIVRISSSLSAILGTPIIVNKIRGKKGGEKTEPGIRPQHLKGLELVREISSGQLEGGKIGSSEITFRPGSICGGELEADTQGAGSTCLLMQSILPCCLFAKGSSTIILKGGTNAAKSPSIDYTTEVFKRVCEKIGISFELSLEKRGFFPKGGGKMTLKVEPMMNCIPAFSLMDQGKVISIGGISCVAGARLISLADSTADAAEIILKGHFGCAINIERYKEKPEKTFGNGSFIIIWAETSSGCIFGSSAVIRKETESEKIAREVAEDLIKDVTSGSCVDQWAQDQLVIFMALAKGTSRIRTANLTLHTKTAIHIAEEVAKVKFKFTEDPTTNTVIMECEGVGAVAHSG